MVCWSYFYVHLDMDIMDSGSTMDEALMDIDDVTTVSRNFLCRLIVLARRCHARIVVASRL